MVLITGFNGILILAFADVVDDVNGTPELDDNDSRPVELARSFNFCEKPMLGGFTANE